MHSTSKVPDPKEHYQGTQYECVMVMNESIHETVDEWICFNSFMPDFEYDAYENKLHEIQRRQNEMMLHLEPGESRIYLHMADCNSLTVYPPKVSAQAKRELSGPFNVSCCRVTARNSFEYIGEINKLTDFSTDPSFSDFHGIIRYECEFSLDSKEITGKEMLSFDHATEIVSVKVNGQNAGVRVGRPYLFSIGDFLSPGKNTLTIEHINTVYPYQKDYWAVNSALYALGLTGNIYIEYPDKF